MGRSIAAARRRRVRRRLTPIAVCVAALVAAFATGGVLTNSVAYGARMDDCSIAESASTNTVMTKTTNYYNCHPNMGNSLPTGGVIGTISQGSNPAVTGRWWNTIAVDVDGAGGACQPTTKWLRGSGFNWFSATCTQAP